MPEQPNHCTGCGILMPYTNAAYYCSEKCMKKVLGTAKREGKEAEHLKFCGWCRQGLECPYDHH